MSNKLGDQLPSRRSFLTKIGLLSGLALPGLLSWDLLQAAPSLGTGLPSAQRLEENKQVSVVILGAGLAGLAAAYELKQLGYSCTILEARHRVGGRAFTVRKGDRSSETNNGSLTADFDGGQYFNAGPSRIPHFHAITLHYCRQFNVPLEVYNNVNEAAYYFSEGKGKLSNTKIKKGTLHNDMRGYTMELLAKSMNSQALDQPLSKEDLEKFLEYLRAEGALDIDNAYKGSSRRGFTKYPAAGNEAGAFDTPHALADFVQSGLLDPDFYGVAEYVYEMQQTMLQMVGGNDALVKAFQAQLEAAITLNAEVTQIQNDAEKVTITYRTPTGVYQRTADFCINTIPLKVLSDINHNYSSAHTRAIDKTVYIDCGKIGLQFNRRFWEEEEEIFGGITHTNNDLFQIFYPSNDYLSKKGTLIGYYNFNERARKVGALSYKDREQLAVQKGRLIHPQYDKDFDHKSFSVSWQHTKYSLGGWAIYSEKERGSIYQALLQPDKRTYFAGEHLTYLNGWMAGALQSAQHVVTSLHNRIISNQETT